MLPPFINNGIILVYTENFINARIKFVLTFPHVDKYDIIRVQGSKELIAVLPGVEANINVKYE